MVIFNMNIKTINHTYPLKFVKKPTDYPDAIGAINVIKGDIEIVENMCKDLTDQTILHEYMHGMLLDTGLSILFKDQEEIICDFFSTCYMHFRNNNDKVIK